uniref:tumor protein D52-like isoform X2 n=1 Tax=Styela clava TaxID=7725 RepID=UPI00193A4C05|nr:tumor protein D52-like isoform X2 [Styela clava]
MASTNEGQTLYPDLSPEGEAASLPTDENETTEPPKPDPSDELRQELIKTEEEINTLRQVLQAKEVYAADLRKKLGLTPLNQLSQSFKAELNKVQSSNAYKKTSETLKSAGQSTASAISSLGSSMSQKLSEMKNSQAFKSFEEKVEGVGSTIMAKVSGTGVEKSPETAEEATEITPVTTQPHQSESNPTTDPPPL